jgi:hypothetical protein
MYITSVIFYVYNIRLRLLISYILFLFHRWVPQFLYCKLEITDFAFYTTVLYLFLYNCVVSIIFNTIIVIGLSKKRVLLLIKNLFGGIINGVGRALTIALRFSNENLIGSLGSGVPPMHWMGGGAPTRPQEPNKMMNQIDKFY